MVAARTASRLACDLAAGMPDVGAVNNAVRTAESDCSKGVSSIIRLHRSAMPNARKPFSEEPKPSTLVSLPTRNTALTAMLAGGMVLIARRVTVVLKVS